MPSLRATQPEEDADECTSGQDGWGVVVWDFAFNMVSRGWLVTHLGPRTALQ